MSLAILLVLLGVCPLSVNELKGSIGFPKSIANGTTAYHRSITVKLLGPSLMTLFEALNGSFDLHTVLNFDLQVIDRLEVFISIVSAQTRVFLPLQISWSLDFLWRLQNNKEKKWELITIFAPWDDYGSSKIILTFSPINEKIVSVSVIVTQR